MTTKTRKIATADTHAAVAGAEIEVVVSGPGASLPVTVFEVPVLPFLARSSSTSCGRGGLRQRCSSIEVTRLFT